MGENRLFPLNFARKGIVIPFCLLYKSNNTNWMFYRKFADEGYNTVKNPNIYNVERDKRLSPGLQPMTTGSVLQIRFCFSPVP